MQDIDSKYRLPTPRPQRISQSRHSIVSNPHTPLERIAETLCAVYRRRRKPQNTLVIAQVVVVADNSHRRTMLEQTNRYDPGHTIGGHMFCSRAHMLRYVHMA